MLEQQTAPPPGWYQDLERADRERWWSGTSWTRHTAPDRGASAPLRALRLMRVGANRVLAPLLPAITAALLLLVFVLVVGFNIRPQSSGLPLLIALVAAIVLLGVTSLLLGVVGLTRARRMGGAGLAGLGISVGATLTLGTSLTLAILLAAAFA